jgi:hypothetical protein
VDGRDRPLQVQKTIEFIAHDFNWSFIVLNGFHLKMWSAATKSEIYKLISLQFYSDQHEKLTLSEYRYVVKVFGQWEAALAHNY